MEDGVWGVGGGTVEGMEGNGTMHPPREINIRRYTWPEIRKESGGLQLCVSLREDCMHPRGLPVCPPVVSWSRYRVQGAVCTVHCARGRIVAGDTMLKVVNRLVNRQVNSEVNRPFCMNKVRLGGGGGRRKYSTMYSGAEPVFLNLYGAQESIPRKDFRQPM